MSFTSEVFELADPDAMRALAHPVRLAILHHLLSVESSTATECGREIGESASTCSYHLRTLARFGIVADIDSKDGREHRWRLVMRSFDIVGDTPEQKAAGRILANQLLRQDDDVLAAHLSGQEGYPPEWRGASTIARSTLHLTAVELSELRDQYLAVLRPYLERDEQRAWPDEARRVRIMFRAVLWADDTNRD